MTSRGPFRPKTFYDSMTLCLNVGIFSYASITIIQLEIRFLYSQDTNLMKSANKNNQ